jgi:hypothetical protein
VLHKLPPPDTTVRHRRGYRQLDPEDDTHHSDDDAPEGTMIEDDEDGDHNVDRDSERENIQHDGWYSLSWSFVTSGLLTVSLLHIEAS